MKLAHSVVALDDSGNTLKELLRTLDRNKAKLKLETLDDALMRRTRSIDGTRVAEYAIVSEPM